jgi:hypothetical protein
MLSSLRAITWLRWRLLANTIRGGKRRDRLEQISRAFAVFVPIVVAAMLTGSVIAVTTLAFIGGRAVVDHVIRPELAVIVLRGLLIAMLAVLVILTTSSPGQTTIGRYTRLLLLPIPRGVLHLVEVLANLADPWIVLVAAALLAFGAGMAVAGDFMAALLTIGAGLLVLAVLASFGALVSFLVGWLFRSRRRGELFTLAVVAMLSLGSFLPVFFASRIEDRKGEPRRSGSSRSRPSIADFDRALPRWTGALPSEVYGRTVLNAVAGNPVGAGFGLFTLGAEAALFYVCSSAAHRRMLGALEGGSRRRRAAELPSAGLRLPGLSPAVDAVAWAEVKTALRTVRGRLVVLLPGPLFALLAATLGRIPSETFAVAASQHGHLMFGLGITFSLYSLQAFTMNLFGADRAGLTLQLLSPIRDRELAWGKLIGSALILGVATLICLVASLAAAPYGSPFLWIASFFGGIATFVLLSPLFVWLSALFPLASDLSKTGSGGNPHGFPMLVGTIVTLVFAAPSALIVLAAEFWWKRPVIGFVAAGVWLLIAVTLCVPLVNLAARAIGARRENLALTAQGR